MKNHYTYSTSIGTLSIEADEQAVTAIGFGHCGCSSPQKETPLIREAIKQLNEYLEGRRTVFDLPLRAEGTPFQQKVWDALCDIPYGEVRSYGDIAKAVGNPKASRAVGMANNRNPLAIVVPCHRVVGANGKLVGYAGGLDIKSGLLGIEKVGRLK